MSDDSLNGLIEFLRARCAEERAEAEKQPDETNFEMDSWEIRKDGEQNWPCDDFLRIAKARVLAEVEARGRRLERFADAIRRGHDDYDIATELLLLEALPFADHPDYREEWRP